MKAVVDDGLPVGLTVPALQRLGQGLAGCLDAVIDDAGHAATGAGDGGAVEEVRGDGAAELQVAVDVRVDGAGNHIGARGVYDPRRPPRRLGHAALARAGGQAGLVQQGLPDLGDYAVLDADVGDVLIARSDDSASAYNGVHDQLLSEYRGMSSRAGCTRPVSITQ